MDLLGSSSLSLSGLATGLDTTSVIAQLMAVERRPETLMKATAAAAQTKLDHYRTLNTKLVALQGAAQALKGVTFNLSSFSAKTATSSNTAALTATADTTAGAGSYSINVTQLALAQKTGGGAFASPASAGSLRITDGSSGSFVDVAIGAGATAQDAADAINAANAGMGAAVVSGKLVLTGKQTGVSYSVADTGGGSAFAASLGVDSAADTYQAAQQASLTIDGAFTISSNTNTFTNALPGVTINAVATGASTLTIGQDASATVAKVQDFVAKYNDVIAQINQDSKYDATTKKGGPFLGDGTVQTLETTLNQMVSGLVDPSGASAYSYASEVGLSVQRDGTLSLDQAKLTSALQANPNKVYALFANEDGQTTTDPNGYAVKTNAYGNAGAGTMGDGIANRVAGYIDSLIATASQYNSTLDAGGTRAQGLLLSSINATQTRISDLNKQVEAFEQRMTLRETHLKAQFASMEKIVSQLRSQGSYISGQAVQ